MQKIIDIATGAFLIGIVLSYLTAERIFMNEAASCFTLLFTGIAGICRLSFLFFYKNSTKNSIKNLSITAIDLAFALFLLWIILNSWIVKKWEIDPFLWHKWGAVAGFYLLVRLTAQKKILLYTLVLSGIIQTVIATGQSRGLLSGNHLMFDVTGSFGNPGQLGGYLAVCMTVSLCLCIEGAKARRRESANLRPDASFRTGLLLAVSALQGFGLYLADSRAGWVGLFAGLVVGMFLIARKHESANLRPDISFRAFALSRLRAFALFAFFAVGILFLYNYRPKSADARLLIWRVSCDMITDRPLVGHGAGAFNEKYMLYQADFFEKHPGSKFAVVADNAGYPFNELLNTAICFGLVGVILLLFLLWTALSASSAFKSASDTTPLFKAGLSAWLAFSMFSYPSGVFPLLLLPVVCLGGIESEAKLPFRLPRWFYGVIILFLTVILFQVWQDTAKLKRLSGACMNLHEDTTPGMDEFEHAYDSMKSNPTFNNYYMAWLESQPAERRIAKMKDLLPSCGGYYMKGNLYLETGDMEQAEQAFRTACNMVPTRIRPKYALWQLYVEKGDTAAAKEMAQTILDCPVKAESIYTLKVKKEMREYGK